MLLSSYLKRVGFITGSLHSNTSHSRLEVIKKYLIGAKQFVGGEGFLSLGSAVHERYLEDKKAIALDGDEEKLASAMVKALQKHFIAQQLYKDSTREEKLYVELEGTLITFILDIHQKKKKVGADIKTTTCRTLEDFIKKAREYGYFRQGVTYSRAANLKAFYFIGVTKEINPKIFLLHIQMFPQDIKYAEQELKFLLYFFKNYGNIIGEPKSLKVEGTKSNNNKMSGKDALAKIKEFAAAHKANLSAANKAVALAEKSKAKLQAAIEKFPAKELSLYEEKLDKYKHLD